LCHMNNLQSQMSKNLQQNTITATQFSQNKDQSQLTSKSQNQNQQKTEKSNTSFRKPNGGNLITKNSSAQQRPNGQSRNEKRARWAKRSKPVARPVAVKRGPVKSYTSVCCSLPASKPTAGQKEMAKDAETGKMKGQVKGLGHWRCSGCRKACKVTPQKPAPDVVYPGPLTTSILKEGVNAEANLG
jgi:hypothetical protein